MDKNNNVISSHIFIFPFRWDYIGDNYFLNSSIDKRLNVEKIIELLKCNNWEDDKYNLGNDFVNDDDEYNKYVYFYDNVRNGIYGKNDICNNKRWSNFNLFKISYWSSNHTEKETKYRIVKCLKYNNLGENPKYNITTKHKTYSLKIKNIKLKVYDTGVANLIFFLDNHEHKSEEDILKINDYGRRIYPQYVPIEKVRGSFLATKLSLNLASEIIEENFIYDYKQEPTRISKTILRLLGNKFIYDKNNLEKGSIFINPILDDRMFTMCIYRNNFISGKVKAYGETEYVNRSFWYEYIFIDNNYPTCEDKGMFKELLNRSTYTRWADLGTLYGISRYSFVTLIDQTENTDFLMNHFNNMYYEMVLLALTQRASILRFSDEASKISILGEKDALANIKKLQKYYILFTNNIYFREVTAQEQGIELYNKLMEMMEIERDIKRLGEEINDIHKYTSLISNESTTNLLNIITYLGIGFTACNFVIDLSPKDTNINIMSNLVWLGKRTIYPITAMLIVFKIVNTCFKYGKIRLFYKIIIGTLFLLSFLLIIL
ncbi:hypothetical protein KQI89_16310 [Clostridium sp. MSJ-4]|uniref:CorA-like Mg2+ transporter protein n=1 Tax=Clostridium simiarum TaxID=2841506 RepID=A0ABS6F4A2_9CLOT|nr:hypothetical protein [Clostridium simiarum]MBU5593314.1 hypothetical protein [Clostridium simiarum]